MPDLGVYCPLHEGYAYSGREITGGNSFVWAGARLKKWNTDDTD